MSQCIAFATGVSGDVVVDSAAIIGGILGGLALVVCVAVGVCYLCGLCTGIAVCAGGNGKARSTSAAVGIEPLPKQHEPQPLQTATAEAV